MKKIILFLALAQSVLAVDNVVTMDKTKPGIYKANGPVVSGGNILFGTNSIALSSLSTNGASANWAIVLSGGVWIPAPMTGLTPIPVSNQGSQVSAGMVSMNFTGTGVTAGSAANAITVTIPGLNVATNGASLTSNITNLNMTGSGAPTATVSAGGVTLNYPSTSAPFTHMFLLDAAGSWTNSTGVSQILVELWGAGGAGAANGGGGGGGYARSIVTVTNGQIIPFTRGPSNFAGLTANDGSDGGSGAPGAGGGGLVATEIAFGQSGGTNYGGCCAKGGGGGGSNHPNGGAPGGGAAVGGTPGGGRLINWY